MDKCEVQNDHANLKVSDGLEDCDRNLFDSGRLRFRLIHFSSSSVPDRFYMILVLYIPKCISCDDKK